MMSQFSILNDKFIANRKVYISIQYFYKKVF